MRIPSFIKALIGCTDTESSRYSLGGVYCQHRGNVSVMTATDGRQLVSVSYYDETEGHMESVVDGKSLGKAFGVANKRGKTTTMRLVENKALVEGGGGSAFAEVTDGRFPRYGDCFTAGGGCSVSLCPELLTQVMAVYKAAGVTAVSVWVESPVRGVNFAGTASSGETIRAVLMPKELDGNDERHNSFPSGVDLPAVEPEPAVEEQAVEETAAACA